MAFLVQDLDAKVAHLPGVKAKVFETARKGAARAEAILAAHRYTGASTVTVTRGSTDAFVSVDDTRGDRAAAAIEYGRLRGRGAPTRGVHALRSAF